jgi:hypothetical protein
MQPKKKNTFFRLLVYSMYIRICQETGNVFVVYCIRESPQLIDNPIIGAIKNSFEWGKQA